MTTSMTGTPKATRIERAPTVAEMCLAAGTDAEPYELPPGSIHSAGGMRLRSPLRFELEAVAKVVESAPLAEGISRTGLVPHRVYFYGGFAYDETARSAYALRPDPVTGRARAVPLNLGGRLLSVLGALVRAGGERLPSHSLMHLAGCTCAAAESMNVYVRDLRMALTSTGVCDGHAVIRNEPYKGYYIEPTEEDLENAHRADSAV